MWGFLGVEFWADIALTSCDIGKFLNLTRTQYSQIRDGGNKRPLLELHAISHKP